jgi:processive 1,2-diacylglycerol beta-glucosyltransferase
MNRILILTVSTGSGHNIAAKALEKEARLSFSEAEILYMDLAEHVSPLTRKVFFDSYESVALSYPKLWGILYKAGDNKIIKFFLNIFLWFFYTLSTRKFLSEVKKFKPTNIISTHFTSAEIIYKKYKKIPLDNIAVVLTDYAVHRFWFVGKHAQYFVSTKNMKNQLIAFGAKSEHIYITGIPVRNTFLSKSLEPTQQKEDDCENILLLSGGAGLIELEEVVKKLIKHNKSRAITVVAGKNKKLKKNLEQITVQNNIKYKVHGWVANMAELMSWADVIISKPGGMTTSECIALGKPLIAISPIPGQEEENAIYLEINKLGVYCKNILSIEEAIAQSKELNISKQKKNAAHAILQTILN